MRRLSFLKFTLAALLLGAVASVSAQQRTVAGKITDQVSGKPLPEATILIKGTSTNVPVNADGTFSLTTTDKQLTLVVSYVGYASQELAVANQSSVDIKLSNAVATLDDVVVIGYGQVKKRDLTGSVVSIKGTEATKVPVTNPIEALQGKIAGADIYRSNGYAGGNPNVRIRGTRSINNPGSSNNVLYIVDGVQGVNIADVNPNDIQSIEVLKDASSTAIYGSRGANGVIIITTKRGNSGRPSITFNAYTGMSNVAKYGDIQSGPQYIDFKREAYRASGTWINPADDSKIFNPLELDAIQKQQYIKWDDLLLHNGYQQDYQVGVNAGSDKTKVYFSAGYFHEDGILKLNDFKRYSSRLNIDQTINSWMKAGISAQYAFTNDDIRRDPFNLAWKAIPLGIPYDAEGKVVIYPVGGAERSPLLDEQPGEWFSNRKSSRFSGSAYLAFNPAKDFDIRSTFSTTQENVNFGTYFGKNSINGNGANSQSNITTTQNSFISWENIATYKKTIGDHTIGLTGITSYLQNISTNSFLQGRNQLFPSQLVYNMASANQNMSFGSGYSKYNLFSLAGRINYDFKGKYLLTLTGRTDGSSKLGPGNKWAFFPSAAAAWRISDEDFMSRFEKINELKLRVSYGVSGNDVINPYATQDGLSLVQFAYNDAGPATAYTISPTIGNDNLKWELTATTNIGVDVTLFNNRINASIDYYDALTKDLIFPYTLPSSTGVSTANVNVGKTRNKGVELSLTSVNIQKNDFRWTSTVTFARNKEKIVSLPTGNVYANDYRRSLIVGESPTIFYDYLKVGIWQLGEEAEATKYESIPGDIKIADISGPDGRPDGKITPADRTIIGTAVPKWTGGFSNDISFKNFDLNILFIARVGQWMTSDYFAKYYRNAAQNGAVFDYWTPENPTNAYPRPHATRTMNYITTLTEAENTYVKLRNITLGYTLPKSVLNKVRINALRVYVSAKNIAFWSKYNKEFDPESEGIVDQPLNKMVVAGLNLTF